MDSPQKYTITTREYSVRGKAKVMTAMSTSTPRVEALATSIHSESRDPRRRGR